MNFNTIKTKMICKIIVLIFFVCLETFIYINQVGSTNSEQIPKTKSADQIKTVVQATPLPSPNEQTEAVSQEEDINDSDDSNITTKIYKSNEPSSELLEDLSNLDSSTEQDIINKDELIGKKKSSKTVKRLKTNRVKNDKLQRGNFTLVPWIMLIVLILILSFIFRILKQKKV